MLVPCLQAQEYGNNPFQQIKETEAFEPLEARGEDPEIDLQATEEAIFAPQESSYSGRRLSETLTDFMQAFGDGARHIDLTDRYSE